MLIFWERISWNGLVFRQWIRDFQSPSGFCQKFLYRTANTSGADAPSLTLFYNDAIISKLFFRRDVIEWSLLLCQSVLYHQFIFQKWIVSRSFLTISEVFVRGRIWHDGVCSLFWATSASEWIDATIMRIQSCLLNLLSVLVISEKKNSTTD